jgi:DNA-binding transcriptional LysR family regulator
MSQSPLSRAIRELERELGVVLFVRTTRRVELTPAGSALLVRARGALAEIDLAVDDARRAAQPEHGVVGIGFGPFSRPLAARIAEELAARRPELTVRLEEDVSPELLRRVAAHELAMAAVFETPGAGAPPRRQDRRAEGRAAACRAARDAPLRRRGSDPDRRLRRGMRAAAARADRPGVQRVAARRRKSRGVRARADARDAERSLGRLGDHGVAAAIGAATGVDPVTVRSQRRRGSPPAGSARRTRWRRSWRSSPHPAPPTSPAPTT